MTKIFLVLLMVIMGNNLPAFAQADEHTIAPLLEEKTFPGTDVNYNAVRLIPRLYTGNKMDTVKAIINYWEETAGMIEPLFTYIVLNEIKDGSFDEKVYKYSAADSMANSHAYRVDYYKAHIVSYLRRYMYGCNIRKEPGRYILHDTASYIIAAYGNYYDFLQSLASSLCDKKGLTPVEKFLVHFYADPDTGMFSGLRSSVYKGSVIRDVYKKKNEELDDLRGLYLSVGTGVWIPQGNIAALQSKAQPVFGFSGGGRSGKLMYDLIISFRYQTIASPFTIRDNDSLYAAKSQGGASAGLNWGYQLYRTNRSEVDVRWGAGWDTFDATYDSAKTKSYNALNLNVGFSYGFFLRPGIEISIKARYNFLDYSNPGGTSVAGNSITIGLEIGFYGGPGNGREMLSGLGNAILHH